MTCGIYKLNFESEHFYIGKSINIEERWKQHFIKFEKGTAAKAMQACFNDHGYPDTEIIISCHPDHLDVLEPLYINAYYNSAYCLNSDKPTVYHQPSEFTKYIELLKESTFSHLDRILELKTSKDIEYFNFTKAIQDLKRNHQKELENLKKLPEILEALDTKEAFNIQAYKIRYLTTELNNKQSMLELSIEQYEKERDRSWWNKLWH